MKRTFVFRTFFVIALLLAPSAAMGYRHFYRAGPYQSEPRYDRNCLTSIDAYVMGGSTKKGRDSGKNKTEALDIYGLQNLKDLFRGIDDSPLTAAQKTIVAGVLAPFAGSTNYGKASFTSKFKYVGVNLSLTQNFCSGFFAQVNIPISKMEVTDVTLVDQSNATEKAIAAWDTYLNNLNTILGQYNLSKGNVKRTGLGDVTVLGGWTYNNDSSDILDFFDVTIKAGLSVPTAKRQDIKEAYSIPIGYNGHVGIPVSFDMGLGLFDWFTWGAHVGGQFFLKRESSFRMKTNAGQNGWIKVGVGAAEEDIGNIWDIGTYVKADHFWGGCSVMVGYNYSAQEDTTLDVLTPTNGDFKFTNEIVNTDEMMKKWRLHTISVSGEYDFAEEGKNWNPRVGVFYNQPVGGKRCFNTNTFGGSGGLNITWNF